MNEIQRLEQEIMEKVEKLNALKKASPLVEVPNHKFKTLEGEVSLKDLFGGKETLLAIHNMGQGCRYCTTWADGLNGFLGHVESQFAVALLSKDAPELQRTFANSRGWRFRMVSHGGTDYMKSESVTGDGGNSPGLVCYFQKDGKIFKKNWSVFGPNDLYCSLWHVIALAGHNSETFTPQYNYWKRPEKMDDGGKNLN